jgi:hypothetical protein
MRIFWAQRDASSTRDTIFRSQHCQAAVVLTDANVKE